MAKNLVDIILEAADNHDGVEATKSALKAAGIHHEYEITHSPEYDHKHITAGHAKGIKVTLKGPLGDHRDKVVKALNDAGHRHGRGLTTSSKDSSSFHLTVYPKK